MKDSSDIPALLGFAIVICGLAIGWVGIQNFNYRHDLEEKLAIALTKTESCEQKIQMILLGTNLRK